MLIPLTVYVGIHYWNDYNFMLVSVLILLYVMAPFFMMFERKKPRARELVLVAVMTALTALGNIVCYITIPFQAGTAMAIVSGIALGPEAGFLVGALARFLCNFFLGQGPWTPWQMFCWGILGFFAGLVFNKNDLDRKKSDHFRVMAGPVTGRAAGCSRGLDRYQDTWRRVLWLAAVPVWGGRDAGRLSDPAKAASSG